MHDSDLAAEQAYLERLYDRLEELIRVTRERLVQAQGNAGGTPQARSERESYIRLYAGELDTYRAAQAGLCFGRLDENHAAPRYIGRVGLRDNSAEMAPLLLDWRSDQSRPFYLATTARPMGVARRRHLRTAGRRITAVHDEYLDPSWGSPHEFSSAADVAGETALLAALERARTGHMTDVVATIQREQDLIIRNPHRGVLVVQGGPGTGKTAVALHRAAYLLYTHRGQLDRSGVLILGPNPTFLDYIARVLPSLGESGVVLRTVGDLYPGVKPRGSDSPYSEEIKGALDMVGILAAAVKNYQSAPQQNVLLNVDGMSLCVTPAMVRKARGRARVSRRPHNRAQSVFIDSLLEQLGDLYAAELGAPEPDATAENWAAADAAGLWHDPEFQEAEGPVDTVEVVTVNGTVRPLEPENPQQPTTLLSADDLAEIREDIGGDPAFAELVEAWWPQLTPERVLAELFSDRERIAAAAPDYIEDDHAALYRDVGTEFSPADAPLLDELAEILGIDAEGDREAEERAWEEQLRQAEEALEILQGSASPDIEDELDPEVLAAYDVVDAEMLARRHRADSDLTVAERAAADRSWAFGHVIVDEAQELSPMAWRMVMRRIPNRWMTLVGDIAQTSSPAGVDSWESALSPYVQDRWRLCQLTVNYRTPGPISDLAEAVLQEIDPELSSPVPIRESGHPVTRHHVVDPQHFGKTIQEILQDLPDGRITAIVGTTATLRDYPEIAASAHAVNVAAQSSLPASEDSADPATEDTAAERVRVLDVAEIKGLEFDHVIIIEPSDILHSAVQGMQDLYVAVTRATQQLHIVHAKALPQALTERAATSSTRKG